MKKAALYLRVSTEHQRDAEGFQIQAEAGQRYAERINATILQTYRDVIAGATVTRHALEQLKADAGEYDLIIIPRMDRLARTMEASWEIVRDLGSSGLSIHVADVGEYNPQDPSSVFMFALMSAKSHTDHQNIVTNLEQGRLQKARKGELLRPIKAYGYRDDQPDPETAVWVQRMFSWGTHLGPHKIALELERLGVPTPKGGAVWRASSVKAILANTIYKGVWRYGRSKVCQDCKRITKITHSELVRAEGVSLVCPHCGGVQVAQRFDIAVPALIDEELWDRVNSTRARRVRSRSRPSSRRDILPLQGRIRCGECGSAMSGKTSPQAGSGKTYYYYYCSAIRSTSSVSCEHRKHYRAEALNNLAQEAIMRLAANEQAFTAAYKAPQPQRPDHSHAITRLAAERTQYIRLAAKNLITDEDLAAELERLERLKASLLEQPAKRQADALTYSTWLERVKDHLTGDLYHAVRLSNILITVHPGKRVDVEVL